MRVDWSAFRKVITPETRFWWRDDDAVAPSVALERLMRLQEVSSVPAHLAIVPRNATSELVQIIDANPALIPLVHGWQHANTAQPGQKKSEFQSPRSEAIGETKAALARMRTLFGARLVPVFVPPWNRISDEIAGRLSAQGYRGLSTFGPRARQKDVGVMRLNTHVDPIDWRGTRGLASPQKIVDLATAQLSTYPAEPIGILTHHLVQSEEIWALVQAVMLELLSAGATPISL